MDTPQRALGQWCGGVLYFVCICTALKSVQRPGLCLPAHRKASFLFELLPAKYLARPCPSLWWSCAERSANLPGMRDQGPAVIRATIPLESTALPNLAPGKTCPARENAVFTMQICPLGLDTGGKCSWAALVVVQAQHKSTRKQHSQ